jgi:hypothetical protein
MDNGRHRKPSRQHRERGCRVYSGEVHAKDAGRDSGEMAAVPSRINPRSVARFFSAAAPDSEVLETPRFRSRDQNVWET